MDEVLKKEPGGDAAASESPDAALAAFLLSSPACRRASALLKAGAEVAVYFTDLKGAWRIWKDPGQGVVLAAGKASDPDFDLVVPPAAVAAIGARPDAELGDIGVTFFELLTSKEPALRIHVTVRSGFVKLTGRGWLGLMAGGGPTVLMWMAKRGLRGPGAIAAALGRLKR